ncbi:hypothetical protein P4H66_04540 [Paenibacillus dokdonensis]|uniref:Uncharacterized protein n=1 Tax=Paenibacillus dokdonensis TaxID=2567944 RepID=A0ABU6GIV4_9BACL|nr:hypothetical protein [Paenibacillus dokdonensis]MEC0239138.1 hypothetical protein [Paenibacillus dokdonensis]
MVSRYDSSLQSQNPISQAQNSVEKLHYAVSQAMSHPTGQMVEQAQSRLAHTERAVDQAGNSLNGQAVELAEEMLAEEKGRLASLTSDSDGELTK